MTTVILNHVRTELALHELRPAYETLGADPAADGLSGRPLLLLHGLGEQTPETPPEVTAAWPGAVWGLDFTGHGGSSVPRGGGYTAETLMADVDVALAHLCPNQGSLPVTVVGRGLGGYVALLIAGARPELVRGAVITDGPGLAGGGPAPHSSAVVRARVASAPDTTPDPYALVELSRDVRPGDYATAYVRQAVEFGGIDTPVVVASRARPPWLEAITSQPGVVVEPVEAALSRFSGHPDSV